MKCDWKFYKCSICGNTVEMIHSGGGTMVCCGKDMDLLVPNTTEASTEKHIPVLTRADDKVEINVGSVPHPMTDEHYISWIYLCTGKTGKMVCLSPGEEPKATFCLDPSEHGQVFAYCNLHGLWASEF